MQRSRSDYNDSYYGRGMSRGGRSNNYNDYGVASYDEKLSMIEQNYNDRYYEICNDTNMTEEERNMQMQALNEDTLQEVNELNEAYSSSEEYSEGQDM